MPVKPSQVLAILQAKRQDFESYNRVTLSHIQQYCSALKAFVQLPDETFAQGLSQLPSWGGALPLESFEHTRNGIIEFRVHWQNREQSLAWVGDRLTGVSTFAVDGSQIFPSKDISIPVALVQIGWFENFHCPDGGYRKDITLDVLTPEDLKARNQGRPVDRMVNLHRFTMEIQRLIEYMEAHVHHQNCLVFLDGSLVATFAEALDEDSQKVYVASLRQLLRTSEVCRVPLVAYIDTSYARDLTEMLKMWSESLSDWNDLPETNTVHDAQVLNGLMRGHWGSRTPLCQCRRSGILTQYQTEQEEVAFTYLKTTQDGYPARLELPIWIYEAGLLDTVLNWVRGEVIIGGGYPYVIETADQTAVLQASDRQIFHRILQDWAKEEDLNLRFSRKMVSKVRRR